jgi:DNA-directed RNA polymerase specialized sigma24 family protein
LKDSHPKQAQALYMRAVLDWSVSEVAASLDLTYGTAKTYIFEGNRLLRALVSERCAEFLSPRERAI